MNIRQQCTKSGYSSYLADIEELKKVQLYKERLSSKLYEKIPKVKILLKNFIFYVKINDYKEKY